MTPIVIIHRRCAIALIKVLELQQRSLPIAGRTSGRCAEQGPIQLASRADTDCCGGSVEGRFVILVRRNAPPEL